mmetsp:Transcript_14110/g.27107  ORF Transcript_14110/g.27107 Transcript_14110/m.27107 type:complete len:394 (-) Transcript_14110:247-1428(-)
MDDQASGGILQREAHGVHPLRAPGLRRVSHVGVVPWSERKAEAVHERGPMAHDPRQAPVLGGVLGLQDAAQGAVPHVWVHGAGDALEHVGWGPRGHLVALAAALHALLHSRELPRGQVVELQPLASADVHQLPLSLVTPHRYVSQLDPLVQAGAVREIRGQNDGHRAAQLLPRRNVLQRRLKHLQVLEEVRALRVCGHGLHVLRGGGGAACGLVLPVPHPQHAPPGPGLLHQHHLANEVQEGVAQLCQRLQVRSVRGGVVHAHGAPVGAQGGEQLLVLGLEREGGGAGLRHLRRARAVLRLGVEEHEGRALVGPQLYHRLCLAVVRAYVGAVNANNLSYLEPGKLPFRASEAAHFHTCENFARPRVCKGSVRDVHSAEKVRSFGRQWIVPINN